MMIGERNHLNRTVNVPPWNFRDDPTAGMIFSLSPDNGNANEYSSFLQTEDHPLELQRYLPANDYSDSDSDLLVDAYSCDSFRMYEYKVRTCTRARSHDWTDCPFAHPGEKARRRDPLKYSYSGTPCPEFRKGNCLKGDGCEYSHGVFECWLHPSRYRTQPCKDGMNCLRRVCFFAHAPEQLRVLSPRSRGLVFVPSPENSSPASESPPVSPMASSLGSNSVGEMIASLRQLQLSKVKSISPWGSNLSPTRPSYCSLPSTPSRAIIRPGFGLFDHWENGYPEDEPVMERVESGRGLRAKMFEKLSKENPLSRIDPDPAEPLNPDVGWVSELVK